MTSRTERNTDSLTALNRRRDELLKRLNDGDAQIRDAARSGIDTARWEDLWISLLREYEAVCRQIASGRSELARAA